MVSDFKLFFVVGYQFIEFTVWLSSILNRWKCLDLICRATVENDDNEKKVSFDNEKHPDQNNQKKVRLHSLHLIYSPQFCNFFYLTKLTFLSNQTNRFFYYFPLHKHFTWKMEKSYRYPYIDYENSFCRNEMRLAEF